MINASPRPRYCRWFPGLKLTEMINASLSVSLSPGNLRQYLGRGDALIISVSLSPGNLRQYLGRGDALIISVNLSPGNHRQYLGRGDALIILLSMVPRAQINRDD
jgi:hypothetical protein